MDHWSRRRFALGVGVMSLGLVAGCGRLSWRTPPPPRVPRVGYLALAPTLLETFRQGLHDFGYIDGQNVAIEHRSADGNEERLAPLAAELIAVPVDVLVTVAGIAARAAVAATTTTPIVGVVNPDPVESGIGVTSLGRPGGNLTGTAIMSAQLGSKRLELLKEVYPGAASVGAFWARYNPTQAVQQRQTEAAASILSLRIMSLTVESSSDFDDAFSLALDGGVDALFVADHPLMYGNQTRIIDFAAKSRLPAVYPGRSFPIAGGLMGYGAEARAAVRRAGYYVDRILKGASPADLPIEQPREFEFVINLKTAQALGLTIPPHVLLQATEVIQ